MAEMMTQSWRHVAFETVRDWINENNYNIAIDSIRGSTRYDDEGWYFTDCTINYYPDITGHCYYVNWCYVSDGMLSNGAKTVYDNALQGTNDHTKLILDLYKGAHYSGGGSKIYHVCFMVWEQTNNVTGFDKDEYKKEKLKQLDNSGIGWGLLGWMFPVLTIVGIIFWRDSYPRRVRIMSIGTILSIGISTILFILVHIA